MVTGIEQTVKLTITKDKDYTVQEYEGTPTEILDLLDKSKLTDDEKDALARSIAKSHVITEVNQ